MSGAEPDSSPRSIWRIPDWYRRVGLVSWFLLGIAAAVALVAVIVAATSEIVSPLVLGGFLAVVFLPLVDWLEARHVGRSLAALTVLIGLVVVVVGVAWIAGFALVDQGDALTATLDSAVADIQGWVADTPANQDLVDQVRATAADAGPTLAGGLAGQAISLIDSAFGVITGAVLGTMVLYYLLKDGPTLSGKWLEREEDDEARALYGRIGERTVANVQSYFKGRTGIALSNGVALGLAALLLGVPAAGAIAVVNFIGSYIPYLGGFVGGAFAVLLALGDGGIGPALVMLGIALAVNLLLENFLEPVLLGGSLDLHPLLILLATSLGGMVAGMIGLVLAAPALAITIDVQRELKAAGFFDDYE